MDHEDRQTKRSSGNDAFVLGLLTGAVLGVGLGMLFAQKAGSDFRTRLKEQARDAIDRGSEQVRRIVDRTAPLAPEDAPNQVPATSNGPSKSSRVGANAGTEEEG